jgi:Tfp pilus assembly protein PilV
MAMTTSKRSEAGFTLVSVMIAVILLALGLIALAKAEGVLARAETDTANRSSALAIAQGYTEVVRSRDPAVLVSESAVQVNANGQPAAGGLYSRSTTVTADAANLLRVTVTVSYPRAASPLRIVTLIYKPTST